MATKKEMDDLKRRFISAETEEERNEIGKEISAAIEQNAEEVAAITLSQIIETNERAQDELVRNRLKSWTTGRGEMCSTWWMAGKIPWARWRLQVPPLSTGWTVM